MTTASSSPRPSSHSASPGTALRSESGLALFWLVTCRNQLERICPDFPLWYNRDRPHGCFGGRTPNEVYFGLPTVVRRPVTRITYFDGRLDWYRFG
ncbi:MAG: hypothetical protein QM765_09275 [Myxococcales bacterium]